MTEQTFTHSNSRPVPMDGQAGFSYIDVMIGLVILMVGILAPLSGVTASIVQARSHEQQLLAKQIASSAMESIMSVKETDPARLGWDAVANVGSGSGIFLTGSQPVYINAGTDEVIGTADDSGTQIPSVSRQITITDICDPERPSYNCSPAGTRAVKFRSVVITVTYFVGGLQRQEKLETILSDYSVTN